MMHNDSRSQSKTIGIVKLRSLGDSILTTAFLQSLKRECPNDHLIYFVPDSYLKLFEREPYKVVGIPKKFNDLLLYKEFKKLDVLFILHASHHLGVIAKASGVKERIVHHHGIHEKDTGSTYEIPDTGKIKSILERDLDGLRAYLNKPLEVQSPKLLGYSTEEKKEGILFLPGGSRPTKVYPHFEALIARFKNAGKRTILVTENKPEKNLGTDEQIFGLSLPELAQKIAKYKFVIANDSGIFHLAKSLNLKSLCIIGPENPNEWHPYKDEIAYFEVPCRNEGKFPFNYCTKVTCRHHSCMTSQLPDYVFERFSHLFD